MGAQKGKDLLLKLDFDQNGTFETVAGMRSRRIALNAESVDITNADSAGRWRELLEGAGVRRAGISGSESSRTRTPMRASESCSSTGRSAAGRSSCRISARSAGRSR